jgi:hypothetical protein
MNIKHLDYLARKLVTKVTHIKVDMMIDRDRTKEDVEAALLLVDRISAELQSLKLEIDRDRENFIKNVDR